MWGRTRRQPPQEHFDLVHQDDRVFRARLTVDGGQEPILVGLVLFQTHVTRSGRMTPALHPGFQDGDLDQQLPQLGAAVDLEFSACRTQEEGAEGRLDHVLGLHASREPATEMLLRQPAQAIRVVGKQLARSIPVTVAMAFHKFGDRSGFGHV